MTEMYCWADIYVDSMSGLDYIQCAMNAFDRRAEKDNVKFDLTKMTRIIQDSKQYPGKKEIVFECETIEEEDENK